MVSAVPLVWRAAAIGEGGPGSEYFFERTIKKNINDYSQLGISAGTINNLKNIINVETKGQETKLLDATGNSVLTKKILASHNDLVEEISLPSYSECYISKQPKATIVRVKNNSLIVFAKKMDEAIAVLEKIRYEYEQINKITQDFELNLSQFLTGTDLVLDMLNKINENLKNITLKTEKNDFEKEVINHVKTITNSFVSNAEIMFDKPTETFEYDILIPIFSDSLLDIEVTDYETAKKSVHENADSLKSQLILSTLDKAQRINASPIIVAKGFPKENFEQMKELANSRNITIFNNLDYKDALEELIISKFVNRYYERASMFTKNQRLRERRTFKEEGEVARFRAP